jgi:hypothetical protein
MNKKMDLPFAGKPELPLDGKSMLKMDNLPDRYGDIETAGEALEAATPPPSNVTLRLHIVWDNSAHNLDLERALDLMRETGAAMVVKVEQVS